MRRIRGCEEVILGLEVLKCEVCLHYTQDLVEQDGERLSRDMYSPRLVAIKEDSDGEDGECNDSDL